MHVLVILAHPKKGSLNHAIAEVVKAQLLEDGHHAVFHDLYEEGFDPVLPPDEIPRDVPLPPGIARHCEEIRVADGIVVIHPNWWGQPPAILKGWIDRVIRPGVAYRFLERDAGAGIPQGLLQATAALVFTTSNTPPEREMAVFGDPLETLWKRCIFSLCGVETFHRRNFSVVVTSTLETRTAWLTEVRELVHRTFPDKPVADRCGERTEQDPDEFTERGTMSRPEA